MSSGSVTFCRLPPSRRVPAWRVSLACVLAVLASSCSELQARRHARAGNVYFQESRYAAAVHEYELAAELSPGLYQVSLNRGLACRELMMLSSAPSADRERAVECALAAFSRLKELRSEDPRSDRLFLQTLFDAQRFDALSAIYEARLREKPDDLASINELIAVYSRLDRWADVLRWSMKRARIDGKDAEAQYAVGAMIFQRLHQKRSESEVSDDPRPDPSIDANGQPLQAQPAEAGPTGRARPRLADLGIAYLNRAIELRPGYREAMAVMGLLRRQETDGPFNEPIEWELLDDELLLEPIEVPHWGPAGPDPGAQPAAPAPGTPT